jgi:hypothetical protein
MSIKHLVSALIILFAALSCSSKKNNTNNKTKTTINDTLSKRHLEDGYHKATILFFKNTESPCDYLIELDDEQRTLLEISNKIDEDLKFDNNAIWVKYRPLRRMSQCTNSIPVEIIAIEKR